MWILPQRTVLSTLNVSLRVLQTKDEASEICCVGTHGYTSVLWCLTKFSFLLRPIKSEEIDASLL